MGTDHATRLNKSNSYLEQHDILCARVSLLRYVFHILRVGQMVMLSLDSTMEDLQNASKTLPFREQRRLEYHKNHPDWFVPNLAKDASCTLEVELRPVCFAPLLFRATSAQGPAKSDFAEIASTCECGHEVAGFGNDCIVQQEVLLPASQASCVFARGGKRGRDGLIAKGGSASLLGKSDLVLWLQDVAVSGKFTVLRLMDEPDKRFEVRKRTSQDQISTLFHHSEPCSSLFMRSGQMLLGTTQDATDSEEDSVPITIVPHPPPVYLSSKEDTSWLIPDFDVNSRRTSYSECSLQSSPPSANVSVRDARFKVEVSKASLSNDCLGCEVMEQRYTVIKATNYAASCGSCTYIHWDGSHDLSVTSSYAGCLDGAIALDDLAALSKLGCAIVLS